MTFSDAEAVQLLTDMLSIQSLCGQEDRLANRLVERMTQAGFDASRDEVGNAIGHIGPQTASHHILLLGHMDTVPGTIPVEQQDGKLYGRGSVDAKGPLATALVAASNASTRARVTIIGAVQEEGPSAGARHLVNLPSPTYLIIAEPSGWDAVVLGYKGSQRFTVRLCQPAGHTAGPEPSAAERAVAFWNDLVRWCSRQSDDRSATASEQANKTSSSGFSKGCFTQLTPTLISINSQSDGLYDVASMHIGLRLPPGVTPEAVREGVRSLLPDAEFDFCAGEPAVRSEKNTPLAASFLRSIRAEGGTPRFKVKTGTSDMNVVGPVWGCPMLAYGPGDSRLDHTPHEHVEVEEYLRAIRVLTRVLEEL